jgi:hypothetical protein
MEPIDTTNFIPSELKAEYAKLLDDLAKGIRDPEAAKKACERMDRMREANRKQFGEQNWIVETIRKMRNGVDMSADISQFRINNENSEDTFDSTDNLEDAIRIAREAARQGQAGDPVCIERNGLNIMHFVLMPDGKVAEETLV